ncbi:signal peptidase I [Jeotgalibaca sp. A127]|uniref:signal peptidase I n=1 Tax=Jeotgalibaca sp. A127 TaxID=3457324 RepID=UPI003FD40DF9
MDNNQKEIKSKGYNLIKEIVNILLSVVVAYVLFILIRTFLFFPFEVVGDSMVPTLTSGDRLILNRLGTVDRFDVVVFPAPDNPTDGEEYVKRIIGLPGDEITYYKDDLFINGELVEEHYLEPLKETVDEGQITNDFSLVDIPGSTSAVVPPDTFFVMGDNRQVSKDSRMFGFVPAEEIEGTSSLRIWPLDKIGFLGKNE